MNRASGSICSRSPGRTEEAAEELEPLGGAVELRRPPARPRRAGGSSRTHPRPSRTASRSILPRRAASTIGTGGGACSNLNPERVRSPASAGRRKSTVSETFESGRSNGISFQPPTIRSEEAPIPRTKRSAAVRERRRLLRQQRRAAGEDPDDAGAQAHRLRPAGGQRQRREPVGARWSRRSTGRCIRPPPPADQFRVVAQRRPRGRSG